MTLLPFEGDHTYEQPHSKWVMSEMRVHDGASGDTPAAWKSKGSDWQRMGFAYANGNYDRHERDFLGYARVTSTQYDTGGKDAAGLLNASTYRKTEQVYANASVYERGLVLSETAQDAQGRLLSRSTSEYDYWQVGESTNKAVVPSTLSLAEKSTVTLMPRQRRNQKEYFEEGQGGQSTYSMQGYDALGNVVSLEEGGTGVEAVNALIGYANCASSYVMGAASSIIVTAGGQQLRRREGQVNCATGKLGSQSAWVDASQSADTLFTWDEYGNLKTIEGPKNAQGQRLKLSYSYDAETQSQPVLIRNESYKLESSASYDPKWAKPVTTVDANGQSITYTYDQFGRTTAILGPQERAMGQPWTLRFSYSPACAMPDDNDAPNCISSASTEHADRQLGVDGKVSYRADAIETLLLSDGVGRVLQTSKDASVAQSAGVAAQDSMIASGRTAWDALGRTVAQYHPTASPKGTGNLQLQAPDGSAPPATTEYDSHDRPVLSVQPDGTKTTMRYGFGADANGQPRFMTETTDPLGNRKQMYKDVRGNITTVIEGLGQ